ncbi:MAG: hypothetical protein NWF05_07045 [Candidatus Bathyarchaeota archaeon]|nr:hypothetical protein [Candidatus Bathyarchaeota archaeon]
MSQTKLSTDELKTWLQTETGSVLAPVQARAQKHLDETRTALENLSEASKTLSENSQKEIEKRNMKVYNRARALNKLSSLFMDRIKKLKTPDQVSFDSLSSFAVETQKMMNVFEIDIRNWFPRISPFFIMDRRKFLTVYEKNKLTINDFIEFVNKEYIKSKTLEKTFEYLAELQTVERQLTEIETEKGSIVNERSLLETEMAELERQAETFKNKAVLAQLSSLDAESETLNNELKQLLRHLQKPFLKMQALATYGGGGGITPDELTMIGLYMDNPFEAVAAEAPGCPVLRQILEKLTNLLAEDKLKLKPVKQRKAEQDVNELLNSESLTVLHRKCVEVAALKKQLSTSPELEEAKNGLSLFQQQMETLRVRVGSVEADECMKENQRQELLDRTRYLKSAIESNVLSFMGKQVQIQ